MTGLASRDYTAASGCAAAASTPGHTQAPAHAYKAEPTAPGKAKPKDGYVTCF